MLFTRDMEVVFPLMVLNSRISQMDVDGQVNTKPGGCNDDKIIFMKYPLPFL
jgi:hypothetical protein